MGAQDTFSALIDMTSASQVLFALYNADEKIPQGSSSRPKLYLHFKNLPLTPEHYLPHWFMAIFASTMSLKLSSHLWDIYICETVKIFNMGFVGKHHGEEVKALLAVSGHITEVDEDLFFDEILSHKGVDLSEKRFKGLLCTHMPRSTTATHSNTNTQQRKDIYFIKL